MKVDVLGMAVDDISFDEAVGKILKFSQDPRKGHFVVTVNSEIVMLARRDRRFLNILKKADLCLADGMGVVLAKLIFGGKVHERITGVDLVENLCQKSVQKPIRIGFLGGFGDVANILVKRQKKQNPNLTVVFIGSGNPAIGQDLKLRSAIDASGRIDLLFVAFGMGRQEFWIERNRKLLANVGVFIGVGGAFDMLAGVKMRAPSFLQKTGLEWLWRLILEPHRAGRMLVLPLFLFLVLQKRFRKKLL